MNAKTNKQRPQIAHCHLQNWTFFFLAVSMTKALPCLERMRKHLNDKTTGSFRHRWTTVKKGDCDRTELVTTAIIKGNLQRRNGYKRNEEGKKSVLP